jgi:hypothetical protein
MGIGQSMDNEQFINFRDDRTSTSECIEAGTVLYTTQYRYISYAKRTYMVTRRKAAEAKRIVLLAVLPVMRIASEIMKIMQIT